MMAGAAAFVAAYPALQPLIKGLGDWGKITLPEVTHTSPWLWIGGLALIGLGAVIAERLSGHGPTQRREREPRGAHT